MSIRLNGIALMAACAAGPVTAAVADSCWDHNGSLMRLEASGSSRTFVYEIPRAGLREVGVRPGTVLFEGRKVGDLYEGTARVFLAVCGGREHHYRVAGPVGADQLTVVMSGTREAHEAGCRPTGRFVTDELRFTYVRQCSPGEFDRAVEPRSRDPAPPPSGAQPGLRPVGGGVH